MNRKFLYLLLVILFFSCAGKEAVLKKKLKKSFRNLGSTKEDIGKKIEISGNDRYIIVGSTKAIDNWSDMWVIMVEQDGEKIWEKFFGGPHIDWGEAICSATTNFFYIVGTTYSFGNGNGDVWIVKMDINGNKIWDKTFGGALWDGAEDCCSEDGNCVIAGWTASFAQGKQDAYIIKVSNNGELIWEKSFGGEMDDFANAVCATKDNGYIVVGAKELKQNKEKNVWILKITGNGKKVWENSFGGIKSDVGEDVICCDGNYIVIGSTESFSKGKKDLLFLQFKSE